jgi:hypothetical protein
MPDCDYCGESFENEEAYLSHLQSEHQGELSGLDQRRVDDFDADEDGFPIGAAILGGTLVAAFAVVALLVVTMGGSGGGSDGPSNLGSVHEHGTMVVTIEGETFDLNSQEFLLQDDFFHFEGNELQNGVDIWHIHGQGVTLKYALESLGISVNDEGTVLSYDGTTYRANDSGTEIVIEVNGEPVEPAEYQPAGVGPVEDVANGDGGGDSIVVEVRTDG